MFKSGSIFTIFESLNLSPISILICFILLWVFVIIIVIKAKKNRTEDRPVIAQYEIPEMSPLLARYILVSGKEGGKRGEISKSGTQRILMIDLYENGALNNLNFIDDITIEYEINPNYKNLNLKEEQIIFLNLLQQNVGSKEVLRELTGAKGYSMNNGFEKIDKFWFDYWHKDLMNKCVKRGYLKNVNGVMSVLSGLLATSMVFGIFFSIFLLIIPFIGIILSSIILLPIIVVYGISFWIEKLILIAFGDYIPVIFFSQEIFPLMFIFIFLSWFAWIYILGQNQVIALTPISQKGKDIIWKINGYKKYLQTVDINRLSFSLDRDLDFKRNNTTFAWLAVFSLAKDKHWDEFMEVHGKVRINKLK